MPAAAHLAARHAGLTARDKFERVMSEFGRGALRSNGARVATRAQAEAIAFSEAREIDPGYGRE